jgi:hypothetical protein
LTGHFHGGEGAFDDNLLLARCLRSPRHPGRMQDSETSRLLDEVEVSVMMRQGFLTTPQRQPLKRVRRVKVGGSPLSTTILEDRR